MAAAPITRSTNPAIREVARGLVQAPDEQILRVVRMLDAMPERGEADHILASLRPRLARLRPPRPLKFARLLFLPLDPLIVPAGRWKQGHVTIPRTAIPPIAAMVEARLGPVSQSVAAMIEGRTTRDHAVIEAAGTLLWQSAAALLIDPPPAAGWDRTSLAITVYAPMARRIGATLAQAARLQGLVADAAQGLVPPDGKVIQAMAIEMLEQEPAVQTMLVALLIARIPEAGAVLTRVANALGQRGETMARHANEQAAEVLLDQLEAPGAAEAQLGGQDLTEAGATVRRLITLLSVLEGDAPHPPPGRRDRLHALRDRIDESARALFTERLTADLLDPLRAGGVADGSEAEWRLEDAARGLRALETEARRAGGGKTYDTVLGQAADRVREITAQGLLGRAGGLRLMEILAGPEVALALFAADA